LYTFAQRNSSPQRTTYTVASLPLINCRITASIMPFVDEGFEALRVFNEFPKVEGDIVACATCRARA
jgi:hypothetical protein